MSEMPKAPKVHEEEFQVLIEAVRSLARSVQVVNQFGVKAEGGGQRDGRAFLAAGGRTAGPTHPGRRPPRRAGLLSRGSSEPLQSLR